MVVTVFGLGFVGLTTALGFAEKGIQVYGIESDAERFNDISNGKVPFFEPGLDDALTRNLGKGFTITSDVPSAVVKSNCVFYCVGTPYGDNGEADLRYLFSAISDTLKAINDDIFRVLVTKSTIPPSTTVERIVPFVEHEMKDCARFGIANNPEFLREGYCWDDFMNADRIVLGVDSEDTKRVLKRLYSRFDIPIFTTSFSTSEFIKYLSNTLLATLISYSNEMANAAYEIGGIDIAEAFKIFHMDKRWGNGSMTSYVYPGCGYGGYCLPKDTNAFYAMMKGYNIDMPILGATIRTNESMPDIVCERITNRLDKSARIGILGLSFKPGSDDVRDTPAAKIIEGLLKREYTNICAYDPIATENFSCHYGFPIEYKASMEDVSGEADILVILTAWDEFMSIGKYSKQVIDCRYMLNLEEN
jgi:UDPglucose 6-dehydrogenase